MSPAPPSVLELGLAVPMFAAPGVPDMRTPNVERLSWPDVLRSITTAEALGYRSAWFSDHLFHGRDGEFLESWTILSAAAGRTSRLRLVSNHLGIGFRAPPLIAKMAATADLVSAGRFELFASHGLREREHTAYGFPWEPRTSRRVARLEEGIEVIRSLWTGQPVDYDGNFHRLRGAICAPAPVHEIPVWVGGPLDRAILQLIATQADGWNAFPASPLDYAGQVEAVEAACERVGRDPATLRRSLETQVLVLDQGSRWDDWMARWTALRRRAPLGFATDDLVSADASGDVTAFTGRADSYIIGSPDQIVEKLSSYRELGVDELVCWFMDWPSEHSMRVLAEDVYPLLCGA